MPIAPLFITGRFRSGSTLVWNLFRNAGGFTAFYEPCHDMLLERCRFESSAAQDHIGVSSYWDEYLSLQAALPLWHSRKFATQSLLLEAEDIWSALQNYINFLLQNAPQSPVLQFNRVDFRLPWIRQHFPESKILHLYRNPRDQWISLSKRLPEDSWNNSLENTPYDLLVWSCSLGREFPFLFSPLVKTAYHRHYLLWKLSMLMGERCSDVSIAFEDIVASPQECLTTMFALAGNSKVNPNDLLHLIVPPKINVWKQYKSEEWFAEAEEECDALLKKLGLMQLFGLKTLKDIRKQYEREWEPFAYSWGKAAVNALLGLHSASRSDGYEKVMLATSAYETAVNELASKEATIKEFTLLAQESVPYNELKGSDMDLAQVNELPQIYHTGLGDVEQMDGRFWRWGLGRDSSFFLHLVQEQAVLLRLRLYTPFEQEKVAIIHNDSPVVLLPDLQEGAVREVEILLEPASSHTVKISYSKNNHDDPKFPGDKRAVAVMYEKILFTAPNGDALSFASDCVEFANTGLPINNDALAREVYKQGYTVLPSLPPVVTLALTTRCNNKIPCVICDRNTRPEMADTDITSEIFEAAHPLIRTAKYLLLHCGGEPMLSPYFDKVFDLVEEPTRVSFATNAMLLTRSRAERMLEKDVMAAFTVSLDAASAETYSFMRPSCDFNKVCDNISYYTELAKKKGRTESKVFLNMTICRSNLADVPMLVDVAGQVGATLVEYNHLNPGLTHIVTRSDGKEWSYLEEASFPDAESHDKLILEAWQKAQAAGIEMVFNGQPFLGEQTAEKAEVTELMKVIPFCEIPEEQWGSEHHKPLRGDLPPCFKPWQETCIQPNGTVRLCYYHDEGTQSVGNILHNDFRQIWNSSAMIEERLRFFTKGIGGRCVTSHPCQRCRPHKE